MPNLSVAFVGLATLAPIFVTKRRSPQRAALAILALVTACAAPPPTAPTAGSTTTAPPVALTAPPKTTAAAPATGVATSVAQPGLATPAAPGALDTLSADQRNAFAAARLLLVEGDFATAADKFQQLSASNLPAVAQTEVRF